MGARTAYCRGSSLQPPKVFSPAAECTVSTDGDRAFHDKYLCWLLMLMASLQTAVKNVDVTDPLNKSLEPSVLHPVLLIGGSKRKTEQPCALRPCQASRGHCGALTLKLNVLSTHITIHSHTPQHCSQAFWNQISQMRKHMTMRASVYGVLTFSSVFQSERNKNKSRLQI